MREAILIGVEVGLLYVPLALGIYVALHILGLPDLTLEGSFGVAAAAMTVALIHGINPALSLILAFAVGALAGLVSSLLHLVLRMNVLLVGLLMMTAAWSIVLIILGTSNVSLLTTPSVFDWGARVGLTSQWTTIVVAGGIALVVLAVLASFFSTSYGLSMRATGMNIQTARRVGIRTEARQVVGLMLGNGLAGLSGGLVVQQEGFMDVSVNLGVVVVGIAAMMIGLTIFRPMRMLRALLAVTAGVLVYRVGVSLALNAGIDPTYVKLLTALLVISVVVVREHARVLLVFSPDEARRQRRARLEFLETDTVAKIT